MILRSFNLFLEHGLSSHTGLVKVGVRSRHLTPRPKYNSDYLYSGASTWSVGSSMVAGGLVWYDAMIAIIIGHLIGSVLTVWNGRGGSIYHIGVCDLAFHVASLELTYNSVPRLDSSDIRSLGWPCPRWYPLRARYGVVWNPDILRCFVPRHRVSMRLRVRPLSPRRTAMPHPSFVPSSCKMC